MRKILLLASALCIAATSVSAYEFNPYVAARAKYAFARNKVKVTGTFEGKDTLNDEIFGGSVAVGNTYNVMNGDFRLELEYTKNADAKEKHAKVKTHGVLLNVYYDFNLRNDIPLTPYIGAGMGWGRAELKAPGNSVKDNGVSAQIGAGINYRLCEHTVVDLGYRYITYDDFDKEYRVPGYLYEKYEYKPRAHEILLGVRYEF